MLVRPHYIPTGLNKIFKCIIRVIYSADMRLTLRRLLTFNLLFGLSAGLGSAQQATVFASGLLNPSKIILGPGGSLAGRRNGEHAEFRPDFRDQPERHAQYPDRCTTLRPLGPPAGDADGPNGLLLDGNTLYIAVGEGDLYANGTVPGTTIVNAAGISSPIFDTLLQVTFSQSVDRIAGAFTLKIADHTTLLDGNPVALTNAAGDKATITLLSEFRFRPDARENIKHSHPYGIARLDSDPGHLYIADAGLNLVHQVDIATGRKRTLVQFPSFPNFGTIAAARGGRRARQRSRLRQPAARDLPHRLPVLATAMPKCCWWIRPPAPRAPFISWLNSAIDIVYRPRGAGERPQFFVLEYSTSFLAGAPGRVLVLHSAGGNSCW